jgi:hypothetical protein
MVYLLIMCIIILICRLILDRNINLEILSKYKFGNYISKFLINYINIWKVSGTFWIFLIIIFLIIFNVSSIYSLQHLISYLGTNL